MKSSKAAIVNVIAGHVALVRKVAKNSTNKLSKGERHADKGELRRLDPRRDGSDKGAGHRVGRRVDQGIENPEPQQNLEDAVQE